jgi:hypothetical protein
MVSPAFKPLIFSRRYDGSQQLVTKASSISACSRQSPSPTSRSEVGRQERKNSELFEVRNMSSDGDADLFRRRTQ